MNPMQVRAIIDQTKATCFMCSWVDEDLRLHGKLTDYPLDSNDKGQFPVAGKLRHLELEQASIVNRLTT